jgi:hypothetical protein
VNRLTCNGASQPYLLYVFWIEGFAGVLGVHAEVATIEHHHHFCGHTLKRLKGLPQ